MTSYERRVGDIDPGDGAASAAVALDEDLQVLIALGLVTRGTAEDAEPTYELTAMGREALGRQVMSGRRSRRVRDGRLPPAA
jgi:hypothetical protein